MVEIQEKRQKAGNIVEKGDEAGLFQFGGSSIVVTIEKDCTDFDEGLLL